MIMLTVLQTSEERTEFLEYYNEYKELMYKVAYHILGNREDSEDAVSRAFISVLENFKKYSKKLNIKCPKTKVFFVNIVERKAIDILRNRMELASADFDEEIYGIPAPQVSDDNNRLDAALAKLRPRYREYILLRYDMGYSIDEMCRLLGESYDSVRKTVYRAKKALEELLNEETEDSDEY